MIFVINWVNIYFAFEANWKWGDKIFIKGFIQISKALSIDVNELSVQMFMTKIIQMGKENCMSSEQSLKFLMKVKWFNVSQ